MFLAQNAPLYGVIGTPYQYSNGGLQALSAADEALPYGHPDLSWFLASQMVRRLRAYTVAGHSCGPLMACGGGRPQRDAMS
ncbi:hypothetical protein [Streptomyces sp. NPDC004680]|uniref:hypothetical protein n=1 Tax=Streptomyces sp. NPDC004680 TaxID=3154287 RepID=UPI00339E9760